MKLSVEKPFRDSRKDLIKKYINAGDAPQGKPDAGSAMPVIFT